MMVRTVSQRNNGIVPVMSPQTTEIPSQGDGLQGSKLHYADVANKHWLNTKKLGNVKTKVIKQDLWDYLEKDDFDYGSLLLLENLQVLER
jgi:hypothetical protein